MSGFCKDCKWWPTDIEFDSVFELYRDCQNPAMNEYSMRDFEPGEDEETPDGLITFGHTGAYGTYTGPDFGCVHFEQRGAA